MASALVVIHHMTIAYNKLYRVDRPLELHALIMSHA